ncbi:MAG: choice-of-anchor R domain-containing protein [Candidatus Daviesbacteria bacterium]
MKEQGQIIILAVIVVGLVLVNTLGIIGGSQIFSQNTNYTLRSTQAVHLAEAGIDKAIASLNTTGGSYNGETKTLLGPGEYTVTVTNKNPTTKIVKSTAYVPSEAEAKSTKTIQIEISRGIGAAFNYGIQVGDGGLVMDLNSQINGSVYANGNIQMGINNRITGDVYVAGGVQPNPDQQSDCSVPSCGDFIFGKSVDGVNRLGVAQGFQPATTNRLNKVAIKLKKFNSPPNLEVRIVGSNAQGNPNKNDIKASTTLTSNLVTGSYNFVEVAFANPPNLNTETTYWILLLVQTADSSNYWSWSSDTSQGYTRGQAKWTPRWQSTNPTWNLLNADLGFKTYVGGQPTYIDGFIAGRIDGDAHANTMRNLNVTGAVYYQAISNVSAGSYHPNSPDPGVASMPLSDGNIAEWKEVAENAGVYNGDITNCPASLSSGKYVGLLHPPDNCTILVDSPIWFTGDVTLGYNTKIQLKPVYGSSSGTFIADGRITLYWKDAIEGSGTAGSYMILVSEFDSKNDPEERHAITFTYKENTGIVYANRGSILVAWGNHLTSVTAWKLHLGFDTSIDYDQGLAGAFFSSGPSGAFSVIKGTYQLK